MAQATQPPPSLLPPGLKSTHGPTHTSRFQLGAVGWNHAGSGGSQTQLRSWTRRRGEARGRARYRYPWQPVMQTRPRSACPSPPAETSVTPIVPSGSTFSRTPRSPPTFCRPLRCARTAGRLPPRLCKAKADALLGRKKPDNTLQAAPRLREGVLQKDENGDPRERHFHM